MKIQEKNVLNTAMSNDTIKCRSGAISRMAMRFHCSTKTISRALKGESGVSDNLYISIRSTALREEEGEAYKISKVKL